MRVPTCLATWLAWLWVGCAGPATVPPGAFAALPWSELPADQATLAARAAADRGLVREALAQLDTVLAEAPDHVDALRLRQDLLRERGRRGRLWTEAEARVRDRGDALAYYLRGRVGTDPEARVRDFRRAAELDSEALWPWLGLAHALRGRDPERALRIYRQLWTGSQGHPLVGIAYGGLLRDRGSHEAALAIAEQVAADPRSVAAGELGRAQALLALGRDEQAWQALLAACRGRPGDGQVQAALQVWLPAVGSNDRLFELLDLLRERPEHLRDFAQSDGVGLLVEILQRAQQPAAALGLLEQVPHLGERPGLARLHRRLLLASGDVAGCLAALRAQVPEAVVRAEPNELRGRWAQLLDGPWFQRDPLQQPQHASELAAALLRTGYLAEAEQWAALALRRWPGTAGLAALLDEVRAELAFEGGLRRLLYRGYRSDPPPPLDTVLEELRTLSQHCFRRDVVGMPPRFVLPLVGELLDPFSGALAEHFARYNRHCVVGQRAGGAVEGMLLSRWSLAELPPSAELPLRGRCREVVCFDRDVRALSGVVGGDVAGLALLHHFLVDHDAVRDWARSLRDRRRIARADGLALLDDPLPESAGMDPFDVAWRLAVQAPVADEDLDAAVLEMIRCHERQHLVDAFQHLPIEANLGRSLGLLWQFGPSPVSIQAEMERRAELAALALSLHPELVLAHIADFLGEAAAESPHHRGFGDLARQLVAALVARGVAEAEAVPSRWHRLDPAQVRQAARDLFAALPR
jgi:tetratricopeptide (TPR) repeat protein